MNVHPNTVKYRIKKVVDIIGIEKFEDCDLKLKIHIALKMRKLFDIDQKDYE
jgi:DNA-binding PucR family transcriptional regulator